MIKLLIISDDFTGALDTGVQFAANGAKTLVTTDINYDYSLPNQPEVLVMNAETRNKTHEQAYDTVFKIAKAAQKQKIKYILKKTDSALRGNIGSELQAVLDATKKKSLVFIPAFPKMNRVTIDGVQYIDGIPAADSVFGKDPFEPVRHSYIPDIIAEQSKINVEIKQMDDIVYESDTAKVLVFDSKAPEDIQKILEGLYEGDMLQLIAGCAGVAMELPKILGLGGYEPELPNLEKKFMVVCGSVNPITKTQLDYAQTNGFKRVSLSLQQKLRSSYWEEKAGEKSITELLKEVERNSLLILDTNDPKGIEETIPYIEAERMTMEEVRFNISHSLGVLVRKMIEKGMKNTLLLTGGDTLLGFMNEMGVKELRPIKELDTGSVLSEFCLNGEAYHIISKSGGFGTEDLMVRLAHIIRKEQKVC